MPRSTVSIRLRGGRLWVGGGVMEGRIREWGSRHGDRVRVVTGVPHAAVPGSLAAMDVLAAPSQTTPRWKEQFGRMLLEAMGTGVPVIASDSGEIPHVVADAGRVVPEADEPAWVVASALLAAAARCRARDAGWRRARSMRGRSSHEKYLEPAMYAGCARSRLTPPRWRPIACFETQPSLQSRTSRKKNVPRGAE